MHAALSPGMTKTRELQPCELVNVAGGAGRTGATFPQPPKPTLLRELPSPLSPITPLLGPKQPLPNTGMAPPKYSAKWWSFVRARGLFK